MTPDALKLINDGAELNFDICIVSFNTKDLTASCLRHLFQVIKSYKCDVWVVDNGSTDGSVEMLQGFDGIRLITRKPDAPEEGHTAHAVAIDLVFNATDKDYLLLMHTDTIVRHDEALCNLFGTLSGGGRIGAVGCLEQTYDGVFNSVFKKFKKLASFRKKQLMYFFGLRNKPPRKIEIPVHIRSFFSLWNISAMKSEGLCFDMDNANPGYSAQNIMSERGYAFVALPPKQIFDYVDHLEAATVAEKNPYHFKHRQSKKFQKKFRDVTQKNHD